MTTREKLTKEYIDISRQMAIKHEEARVYCSRAL